jgi:MmeI, DNA-methyltransferase domain/MmeI, target recognition domain/MmeI, N-terminal domain/MmeI, C-terminal domain/MmeI, helicase spacer domain
MPLSWNEIRNRALKFSKEWADSSSEKADSQTFWNEFFEVFGITRKRVATFEEHVKKLGNKDGFIDLFWKGVLLVEHKSLGKDLDSAYSQAIDYFDSLKERELPRYVLVSDFAHFRLYDLEEDTHSEFNLEMLHQHVDIFGFIAGYQTHVLDEQDPVNIKAAEKMGVLHDQMKDVGYDGHPLEIYLVRLLFCMFAEDTGIFKRQQFQNFIEQRSAEDGSDLGNLLDSLFFILNTPEGKRLKNLDEQMDEFSYINGKLFYERLPPASFNTEMRQTLLNCCALDWGSISPAIFGSLFQSIMDAEARRNLGAHYTSEENILKLITPLFLDELRAEIEHIRGLKRNQANRLEEFHQKLRSLTFLDPACGCGNFLVIAYRELRLIELEILRITYKDGQMVLDVNQMILLNVDQFYGIEIEEFPAQIAQVALWLMDHQMNLAVSKEFGLYFARIPLQASANIICGNALKYNWGNLISPDNLSYIMGNPPFLGKKEQSAAQKMELRNVAKNINRSGTLDFVTGWYFKATEYIDNTNIQCAFVSTNSITQGEQAPVIWSYLFSKNIVLNFAHRTFNWTNEAKGKAAVHCVIIGFSLVEKEKKYIYEYENVKGHSQKILADKINCYLLDASIVLIENRRSPICNISRMIKGCEATDSGHLILTDQEKSKFVAIEPLAKKWIRPFRGGQDIIKGYKRWCLWLKDIQPNELKEMPTVVSRVLEVKKFRELSSKGATVAKAKTPYLFGEIRQSDKGSSIVIPKVSSERREYAPLDFINSEVILNNTVQFIPNGTLYEFAILQSIMHMSWMRTVAGRMKSDYQYSITIVYNNFPWPLNPAKKNIANIEAKAKIVLDARSQFSEATLADLYDPLLMPSVLVKAHQALDKAVDLAYSKKKFKSEANRVAFLFNLYKQYTNLISKE